MHVHMCMFTCTGEVEPSQSATGRQEGLGMWSHISCESKLCLHTCGNGVNSLPFLEVTLEFGEGRFLLLLIACIFLVLLISSGLGVI